MRKWIAAAAGAAGMALFLITCADDPLGDAMAAAMPEQMPCAEFYRRMDHTTLDITTEQWTWYGEFDAGDFNPAADDWPRVVVCHTERWTDGDAVAGACPEGFTCEDIGAPLNYAPLTCYSHLANLHGDKFTYSCGSRSRSNLEGEGTGARAAHVTVFR